MNRMYDCGLLVLFCSNARPTCVSTVLQKCAQSVREILYVHLVNVTEEGFHSLRQLSNPVPCSNNKLAFIKEFYCCAFNDFIDLKVYFILSNISNHDQTKINCLLNNDYQVVLTDIKETNPDVLKTYVQTWFPRQTYLANEDLPIIQLELDLNEVSSSQAGETAEDSKILQYDTVCIGGTFDRLHIGHKILLTHAALITKERLVVGVTNGEMNSKKVLHELMQSTEERILFVKRFLQDIKPQLTYDVVPITDAYGPSIDLQDINCIVVSEETTSGAAAINKLRKQKGFPDLVIEVVDLIYNDSATIHDERKISSSTVRKKLLGTLLKQPELKDLPRQPYVIGLTGGIASGKSSICKMLESHGAGIINCDLLGHQAYEPGTETLKKIVDAFGARVLNESGFIDRKCLGSIVFSDKGMLSLLNSIVWPAIANLVPQHIDNFVKQGKSVIVLDAAVLLEAEWDRATHEVWTAILPAEEAIQRIMNRNNLTREQSEQRIRSQMTNEERVQRSHVVLSTLWEYEVTKKQVEKAWKLLQERINF